MNNLNTSIEVEYAIGSNILLLTEMALELWPECNFEEEFDDWMKISRDENSFCLLAKLNSVYVGFIHVSIRSDYVEGTDFEKTAYLEAIFVKQLYRHRGIGSTLLLRAEMWAKSKGIKQLASDTEIDNLDSQLFHKKAGFLEVNRIVCFMKEIEKCHSYN